MAPTLKYTEEKGRTSGLGTADSRSIAAAGSNGLTALPQRQGTGPT